MKLSRILLILFLCVAPFSLFAQSNYGSQLSDWRIVDNNPADAALNFIDAPLLGKSVVETVSSDRLNAFRVGGNNANNGWANSNEFFFSWRLRASEAIHLYVHVDTTLGWRILRYNQSSKSRLLNSTGRYVHHGLGSALTNGEWHTWSRDLRSDLQAAEPENEILAVNGFTVRGNMQLDAVRLSNQHRLAYPLIANVSTPHPLNSTLSLVAANINTNVSYIWRDNNRNVLGTEAEIEFSQLTVGRSQFTLEVTDSNDASSLESVTIEVKDASIPTVYSDAETNTPGDWRVADNNPEGALIENIIDPDNSENRAIQFTSSGVLNAFIIGSNNAKLGWKNTLQTNISWRSKASQNFRIYVRVITPLGWRYLWYDSRATNRLSNRTGKYIHHGLGSDAINGEWQTFTRDLQADLAAAEPGNTITEVRSVVVRGSLLLDDLSLVGDTSTPPPPPPAPAPDMPVNIEPLVDSQIEAGTTQLFSWEAQSAATTYDFQFFNSATNELTSVNDIDPAVACAEGICSLEQVVLLPAHEDHAWQVRAKNDTGVSDWSRSEFDVLTAITSVPATPSITLPVDNTTFAPDELVTLQWQADDFANAYEFELLGESLLDSNTLSAADVCDQTTCELMLENTIALGDGYQLRIRGTNRLGYSEWASRFFNVQEPITAPEAPQIIFPDEYTVYDVNALIELQWHSDNEVITYDLGLVNLETESASYASAIPASQICDEISCVWNQQNDLLAGDGYQWRVRANNEAGSSAWSTLGFGIAELNPPSPPVAAFTLSTLSGVAPLSVTADASTSSDEQGITHYRWEFSATEVQEGSDAILATHEFTDPGSYTIKLTVWNADDAMATATQEVTVLPAPPVEEPSAEAAARLLAQASFGANATGIEEVQTLGIEGWIDNQLSLQGPPHLDYVLSYSNGSHRSARHEIWWKQAVDGEDQLRGRVAFALSQLFVVSDTGYTLANSQYGITNYYDLLRNHAFGNYRELLEAVTLSPVMGIYLSMLQNDKGNELDNTRADENYAREILQLFSIGLHNLNQDGTRASGSTFTQQQVEDFARVFTGWNYKDAGYWERPLFTNQDLLSPMEPFEDHHDTGAKTLLNGVTLPEGQTARADLEQALDNIAAHPNVAPFISQHLIKHLVTSNPSSAYIGRVAAVFNDNGLGVKGDLKATVKAILMDDEAREPSDWDNYGKLREPVLRLTHLWRAFSITPGNDSLRGEYNTYSPALEDLEEITGQAVLRSPSVFNFYSPTFSPTGPAREAQLIAPEFDIFTDGNILSTASRINSQIHRHYKQNPYTIELNPSYLDYSVELSLADDPQALLDHLNLLLLSGSMSQELNDLLLNHLASLPSDEDGLILRVQNAISLLLASPEYLVQK